jgi:hypothetical protein
MILEDKVKLAVNESDIALSSNEVGILISVFCHDVQL